MNYESDFFMLRTPLLPFRTGLDIFAQLGQKTAFLMETFSDPLLQEAIFLASSDLYQQLLRYLKGEIKEVKKISALEETLIEYLLRMSSRCTPFGLFAGITVGYFQQENVIRLSSVAKKGSLSRSLRLDTVVLSELVRFYDRDLAFRKRATYYVNSSIYRLGSKYRYHEYAITKGRRNYTLSEVDYLPVLGKIIKKAVGGITIDSILALLEGEGFGHEDSESYVQELIDSQLLVSEIQPSVVGDDFFGHLLDKVNSYGLKHKRELNKLAELISGIDGHILGEREYLQLFDLLHVFELNLPKKGLFQVDLNRRAEQISLNQSIKDRVFEAAKVLMGLNGFDLKRSNLEVFKKAFSERYENAAVRLVDVMDVEIGINYKNLKEYISISSTIENAYDKLKKYKRDSFQKAVLEKRHTIVVTAADLEDLGFLARGAKLPQSFSVMVKILDELGKELQIDGITGPSFGKLMGRFCNSNEELKYEVEKLSNRERELFSKQVIAEIVHLPEDRIGNVVNRPHLSSYEIPYLGKSRLPLENQIEITDLYLRMDRGRLLLFSKKLGREITPRLTSAHNFSGGSLPIYHFLCEMQMQGEQGGASWFWEEMENEHFLPRVTYKDIVLSPAKWNIYLREIAAKVKDGKSVSQLTEVLANHLVEAKVSKYVYYTVHDNKLLLDIQTDFGIAYLAKKLIKEGKLLLQEVLLQPESLMVKSDGQGFAHELVIPFVQQPAEDRKEEAPRLFFPPKLRRSFEPGSEWVYYKIYIGSNTASQLLYTVIFPLIKQLLKQGLIKSWFFIRYADPKPHLRIRFLLKDEKYIGLLFLKFEKTIRYHTRNALVSNVKIDTYVREIERYGEETMEISEQFFYVNSSFICGIFEKGDWGNQSFKCQLAFKVMDDLLVCLFPDVQQRYDFINAGVEVRGLGKTPISKSKKEEFNKKYRGFSAEIDRFQCDFMANETVRRALDDHNKFIADNLCHAIFKKGNENAFGLVSSYIHMFANRIFDTHQNEMEVLLYFYLEKYYRSIFGRQKKNQDKGL